MMNIIDKSTYLYQNQFTHNINILNMPFSFKKNRDQMGETSSFSKKIMDRERKLDKEILREC